MADMTITITVTGRFGGNNITWSRTATVENLLGAVHRVADTASGFTSSETTVSYDGIYSSGLGVAAIVQTGQESLAWIQLIDSSKNEYNSVVLTSGVPFILFNGAGAGGFNGGFRNTNTLTDVPDIDIDGMNIRSMSGTATWSGLAGLKLIS
jgi:hypothetical protein